MKLRQAIKETAQEWKEAIPEVLRGTCLWMFLMLPAIIGGILFFFALIEKSRLMLYLSLVLFLLAVPWGFFWVKVLFKLGCEGEEE